jgi:F-type H+-transporting ATPase subunit gamma
VANLRDLRSRIKSVSNTKQLTRAMKMVSASKLRRAQENILSARPYAHRMREVLASAAARAGSLAHPLLAVPDGNRVEVVVVTADKGLCGAFNTNIIKAATRFLEERPGETLSVHCVGRKGRDYFRRRGVEPRKEYIDVFRAVDYARAAAIARDLMDRFIEGDLDAIYVAYNEFKSAIQQNVVVERLLPIDRQEFEGIEPPQDYLYEPSAAELFNWLLPRHVEIQIFRILLESAAAEHGARMAAMDSATNNAGEMIHDLTLHLNRVRQAGITREIIEVVSGARATG